jgi:hypothetical protein
MTDARRFNRLQAGDTFRFAEGTAFEIEDEGRVTKRRWAGQNEHFIVLRAGASTGGDRMGHYGDNGGWQVWAAPKGTALEELADQTIHFYQDGPYRPDALIRVELIQAAKKRTRQVTAYRP